jgi:hypothetical protein
MGVAFALSTGAGTSIAGAALASIITVGCNFTDFSKTIQPEESVIEPACLEPAVLSDAGIPTVAHWTFNGGVQDGQWLDEQGAHALIAGADLHADAGTAAAVDFPRINGEGQSLSLDGHQYLRSVGAAGEELVPHQFTIAAWISLPARAFTSGADAFAWPILSTLGNAEQCDGYQLEIRFQEQSAEPELVLSYQTRLDIDGGASECQVVALRASIEVPSWATGTGRWHHVAGSLARFDNDRFQLALYWDGRRIQLQDPLEPQLEPGDSIGAEERAFYVGTSALGVSSGAQTKFTGYIDDIAVFDRPLTEAELHEFVVASTTRPGPSNCRWRASEQWDKTAFDPSYAAWLSSSPETLTVEIDDRQWGAGALDARIEPPRDIQLYDKAYLEGDFPEGQGLQFTLASGDNYCTWTYLGRGPNHRYEIDLSKPVSCVSTTCEVNLHRVDRASVTSEWAIPSAAKLRHIGPETFVVRRLDFQRAKGALPNWTGYGGAHGLLGYCWRLQAYEPETSAWWTPGAELGADSMSATLKGPSISGARVMADFGDQGLDISKCTKITIRVALEPTGSPTNVYVLAMQDIYGSWRSYDLLRETAPGSGEYDVLIFTDKFSASATDSNFDKFPREMDLQRVRLLGLQKPWGYEGALDVTIRSLSFSDSRCERPGP